MAAQAANSHSSAHEHGKFSCLQLHLDAGCIGAVATCHGHELSTNMKADCT